MMKKLAKLVSNDTSLISSAYHEICGSRSPPPEKDRGVYGKVKEFVDEFKTYYWKNWMERKGLLPGSEPQPRKYTPVLKI